MLLFQKTAAGVPPGENLTVEESLDALAFLEKFGVLFADPQAKIDALKSRSLCFRGDEGKREGCRQYFQLIELQLASDLSKVEPLLEDPVFGAASRDAAEALSWSSALIP